MRKSNLMYKLGLAALFAVALQSCQKENGIDNETVVKKPYGLYIGTDMGALLNTNNGIDYKTVFPPDGFKSRALVTSGMNLIWVKGNVHLSEDNGRNFNPTYFQTYSFYLQVQPYFPWQSVILSATNQNRVYLSSIEGRGVVYSDNNGKTWNVDTLFDHGINNNRVTSFTQLQNGTIFMHNLFNDSIYRKDNKDDRWSHANRDSIGLSSIPHLYYLSHIGNDLLTVDLTGNTGVFRSSNNGVSWTQLTGLPDRLLYTAVAPFDQTLLVGTDSAGVYRLEGNQFVPSNAGLEDYTVVYAIAGKEDIYKNDVAKRYVYIATNKGLYRSEDYGRNWSLVKEGSFVALY